MRDQHSDESGFSLIEVVVAMAVFTVLATVTLGLLVNTTDVAGDNIRRTTATNLVNAQLQTARSLTAQEIPDGRTVTNQTVGAITYTITQTANYAGSNSSTAICSGTGNTLAYKVVTVQVTWPNMGSIKPVRGDTLRAVGVGSDGLSADLGTLAVSITGSTSQPTAGVEIVLTPGTITRTTGDDGCAIFTGLTPGTYTATADSVGYVGTVNTQAAKITNLTAVAGTVARGNLVYDTARSVTLAFDGPAGAIVPSNLVLRAGNTYQPEATLPICAPGSTSACTSAVPGTVSNLFPENYKFKAGTCSETTPSQVAIDLRPSGASGSTLTVPMGAATVKVALTNLPTVGIIGRTVTFTHAAATGCPTGESYSLTSAATGSTILIPYGDWAVSVVVLGVPGLGTGLTASTTVTFGPTNRLKDLNLLVAL